MKRPLALVLLATSILAVPLAQAQFNTSLVLSAAPPEAPLLAGGRLSYGGTATFTADVLVFGNTQGVPVTYTVTQAPEWATVVVSPQSDVFPVMLQPTLAQSASRPFTVLVDGAPVGPDGALGLIEVTATATPTMPGGKAATAKVAVPIRFDAGDAPCPEHDDVQAAFAIIDASMPTPDAAQEDAEASEDGTTTVQSGSATPLALPAAAVLGFAAVGAGVGLVLRRRRGP